MASPFERYVEALGQPPGVEFVVASGRGGVRQPVVGRFGFWLPMTWSVHLVPGSEFVFLAKVKLGGLPLVTGGDELRGGRGRFRMGRRVLDGHAVDRAQHAALWAWSLLLAPGFALGRPDVFLEQADDEHVRLAYPFGTETWECTLGFDPATGLLRRLDTHRDDPSSGRSRRWSAEIDDWHTDPGGTRPGHLLTLWDGIPAVRLDVERAELTPAA